MTYDRNRLRDSSAAGRRRTPRAERLAVLVDDQVEQRVVLRASRTRKVAAVAPLAISCVRRVRSWSDNGARGSSSSARASPLDDEFGLRRTAV